MANLPPYIQYLLATKDYPHTTEEIQLIQTHISFVVIAGEYVYKWKKPVDFGFLDFSTLEKRKYFCQRELHLNRRLCPEVYLGLVSVNLADGRYSLSGPGPAVEYGVKMARMPEEMMMTKMLTAGKLTRAHLDAVVEVLIPFYQAAEGGARIGEFGRSEAVAQNVQENFLQTEAFIGKGVLSLDTFEKIKAYSQSVLADSKRFYRRITAGKIRDCHGDLHSANICLADKVYIFDCIEFNERLRYSDVAADVAFLAMDLDFHGLSEFSSYFVDRFIAKSGDQKLMEVLNFYKCYRAYVRGKIGLFTAEDPTVSTEKARVCREQAGRYFALAARYSEG